MSIPNLTNAVSLLLVCKAAALCVLFHIQVHNRTPLMFRQKDEGRSKHCQRQSGGGWGRCLGKWGNNFHRETRSKITTSRATTAKGLGRASNHLSPPRVWAAARHGLRCYWQKQHCYNTFHHKAVAHRQKWDKHLYQCKQCMAGVS